MDKLDTKEIPEKPGIYIFKDKFEEPLYVGKAKNLPKGTLTHTRLLTRGHSYRASPRTTCAARLPHAEHSRRLQ